MGTAFGLRGERKNCRICVDKIASVMYQLVFKIVKRATGLSHFRYSYHFLTHSLCGDLFSMAVVPLIFFFFQVLFTAVACPGLWELESGCGQG